MPYSTSKWARSRIQALRLTQPNTTTANLLYEAHSAHYYEPLCAFVASGPVVAMVLKKENVVVDFDPPKAIIRECFAQSSVLNVIHGADTSRAASKEIFLFSQAFCKRRV